MKRLLAACLLFLAPLALAQEMEETPATKELTVKRAVTVNKVVIVVAVQGKTTVQLQCNEGFTSCTPLKPGSYLMVQLAKNRGIYDCANVRVYASTANPQTDDTLGEYCIVEPDKS